MSRIVKAYLFSILLLSSSSFALDLDWHGQFRAETNMIYNYDSGVDGTLPSGSTNNGYVVPNTGNSPATFQNLFLRLNPRAIVNDNVSVHSDIWFGLPDRSTFGSDGTAPRSFSSTQTGNADVSARELFAELATDFGTIRVGRIPLNFGLGLIWNNDHTKFDRLPSNGDGFSLFTKLGAFEFTPTIVKYSTLAGTANSGISDYSINLMYKNDDEQVDLGVMLMRRVSGSDSVAMNPFVVDNAPSSGSYRFMGYNIWDFYVKKRAGVFTFSAEVPLVSGLMAGREYSTISGAVKTDAQVNDRWLLSLNAGNASGQDNGNAGTPAGKFTAFYFHPDYRPGFLLFNYNYYAVATGSGSYYDNPVTNAKFLALGAKYNGGGKWTHAFQGVYAIADKTADGVAGNVYFNARDRHYETEKGSAAQEKGLGIEFDYGIGYQWDESIHFGLQLGLYVPGKFYDFSNDGTTAHAHKPIFGSNLNVAVTF